jgi:hypothetical protein
MTSDAITVWDQLNEINETCADLARNEDDAVRMLALRVSAMVTAFQNSMLVPPSGKDAGPHD